MNDFFDVIRRNQEMLDRVIGPKIRVAEEMNRIAREAQETYKDLVRPAMRMAEDMARIRETFEDMARMVELSKRRNKKFSALIKKNKWPPPRHLPSRVIDRIADAYGSGQLSETKVEELFVKAYLPRIMAEIEGKWASYQWLANRLPILREALANYPDGRYYSVVCTLMPQLEGLLGTELGRRPKPNADAPAIFKDSPHGTLVSDYYLQVILETFEAWHPMIPVPGLSRHAILHGRATDYGTKAHALKLIIVTDYLLEGLDSRRNGAH